MTIVICAIYAFVEEEGIKEKIDNSYVQLILSIHRKTAENPYRTKWGTKYNKQ